MNHLLSLIALFLQTIHDVPSWTSSTSVAGDPTPCYAAYQGKLDELLTLDDIRAEFTTLPADVEHAYLTTLPTDLQASQFTWPSDRTDSITMGGRTYTVAASNLIGIGGLSIYKDDVKDPKAKFLNTYRTPTEAEKAYYQKALQDTMEAKGMTESQQRAGQSLGATLADNVKYMPIDGIGDAAAWDVMESALVILVSRAKFRVIVDISDDPAVNLDLAKRLARRIFRKC
jgi:hypothetical protein